MKKQEILDREYQSILSNELLQAEEFKVEVSEDDLLCFEDQFPNTKTTLKESVNNLLYRAKSLKFRLIDKIKKTGAHITGKQLKDNKEYEGASRVGQEEVEKNPKKWIIPECIPACQILWNKNIYTFMCSDRIDSNAWIELVVDDLSEENKAILEEIKQEYHTCAYHSGCLYFAVEGMGKNAEQELIKIANRFQMQDNISKEATVSLEQILISLGYNKMVKNPNYVPFEVLLQQNITFENWGDIDVSQSEPFITVVDPQKITKPLEEYIADYGAVIDEETSKIYRSQYHYQKHQNYLKYLDSNQRKITK